MGYRLKADKCATLKNWRKQTGASGAASIDFAPVRQLRQFLIGRGEVAHLAQHRLARIPEHHGGTRPDGACGLPTMRSPARGICRG